MFAIFLDDRAGDEDGAGPQPRRQAAGDAEAEDSAAMGLEDIIESCSSVSLRPPLAITVTPAPAAIRASAFMPVMARTVRRSHIPTNTVL